MIHDTFGTLDLATVQVWLWESGWDYVQGTIYAKQTSNGEIKGALVMLIDCYALRAI